MLTPATRTIITFTMLFMLLGSVAFNPSLRAATYVPGVQVGDWWKYGNISVQCSPLFCPPEVRVLREVRSIDASVTEIVGSSVTIESVVTFANNTEQTWRLSGNVENGQGDLTYGPVSFLIAGDLVKGDPVYSSPTAPIINDTLATTIAAVPQSVNLLALSNPLYTLLQYWDQERGVLTQAVFSSPLGLLGQIQLVDSIWHHTSDFTVYLNATVVSLEPGQDRHLSATVKSLSGFEGLIDLKILVQLEGIVIGTDPSAVDVQPGGSASSILTIAALQQAPSRTHLVRLTASNQTVSHSTFLTVEVGGFTLASNPQQIKMPPNATATSTITVTSTNNLAGEVHLSAIERTENAYSPIINDLSGPQGFLDPTDVTLTENGKATTTLTVQTPNLPISGNFIIRITATSGTLSHNLDIPVTVTLSPTPDTSSRPANADTILGLSPFQFYSTAAVSAAVLGTATTLLVFSRGRKRSSSQAESQL